MLHRRHAFVVAKKGEDGVRRKGQAEQGYEDRGFSDGPSIPLALYTEGASPHEVALAGAALASALLEKPKSRPIGDKAHGY